MKNPTRLFLPLGVVGLAMAAMSLEAASAPFNETINYSYDARGRLVQVTHSGSVNNTLQANYSYDKADNRDTVNVTGSPN